MNINRIHIIGTTGTGKTYLAKNLSRMLKIKHHDLDDIFWIKKYTKIRPDKERRRLLTQILKNNKWIVEGIYSSWID